MTKSLIPDTLFFMKFFAKETLYFFLIFSSFSVYAGNKPYIISGFDDVLRQADNTGLYNVAIKILEKDKTYSGMPELYNLISKEEVVPKFTLVSAISTMFDRRIDKFLLDSKYPSHQRYLRSWLTEWSIENFKISKIKKIVKENSKRNFIVIFDNSDASLALSRWLQKNLPDRILSIYLREVVSKKLPKKTIPFFTAFDIALNEFMLKRMNLNQVKLVAEAILRESDVEMILPSYGVCPDDYDPCIKKQLLLKNTCVDVKNHIRGLCNRRDH